MHAADVEGLCKGIDEELVQSTLRNRFFFFFFFFPTLSLLSRRRSCTAPTSTDWTDVQSSENGALSRVHMLEEPRVRGHSRRAPQLTILLFLDNLLMNGTSVLQAPMTSLSSNDSRTAK